MKPFVGAKVTWVGAEGAYYVVTKITGKGWFASYHSGNNLPERGGPYIDQAFLTEDETLINYKEHFIKQFKEIYDKH